MYFVGKFKGGKKLNLHVMPYLNKKNPDFFNFIACNIYFKGLLNTKCFADHVRNIDKTNSTKLTSDIPNIRKNIKTSG